MIERSSESFTPLSTCRQVERGSLQYTVSPSVEYLCVPNTMPCVFPNVQNDRHTLTLCPLLTTPTAPKWKKRKNDLENDKKNLLRVSCGWSWRKLTVSFPPNAVFTRLELEETNRTVRLPSGSARVALAQRAEPVRVCVFGLVVLPYSFLLLQYAEGEGGRPTLVT